MDKKKKVVFVTPSRETGPIRLSDGTRPYVDALENSIPSIIAAGWDEGWIPEIGNPYISAARAHMTRKALDAGADVIIYLDDDLSWDPPDLLTLLNTPGDVVAGTYRFKRHDFEEYMGCIFSDATGRPLLRPDGCIKAERVPAGFLKVTKEAIGRFMGAYPHLVYGPPWNPSIDLFNHGAHKGLWYGEDYAFSRNWLDLGGEMWFVPNLNITHHGLWRNFVTGETKEMSYPGNFHEFLLRQPQPNASPRVVELSAARAAAN
jgi:glycosyltransferase involved in cell wall biosynthesis